MIDWPAERAVDLITMTGRVIHGTEEKKRLARSMRLGAAAIVFPVPLEFTDRYFDPHDTRPAGGIPISTEVVNVQKVGMVARVAVKPGERWRRTCHWARMAHLLTNPEGCIVDGERVFPWDVRGRWERLVRLPLDTGWCGRRTYTGPTYGPEIVVWSGSWVSVPESEAS